MQEMPSLARPRGSSEPANALCQQAAGSAGERVTVGKRLASSPCFSEQESESLESLACGTRSYFEPSLIQWKVRGGVIRNCQRISDFTLIRDTSLEEMEAVLERPNTCVGTSLCFYLCAIFSHPFLPFSPHPFHYSSSGLRYFLPGLS